MAPAEEIDICDRCGKTANDFKSKKVFKLHLKENNGHSIESFGCCNCGKSFKSKKKY